MKTINHLHGKPAKRTRPLADMEISQTYLSGVDRLSIDAQASGRLAKEDIDV